MSINICDKNTQIWSQSSANCVCLWLQSGTVPLYYSSLEFTYYNLFLNTTVQFTRLLLNYSGAPARATWSFISKQWAIRNNKLFRLFVAKILCG